MKAHQACLLAAVLVNHMVLMQLPALGQQQSEPARPSAHPYIPERMDALSYAPPQVVDIQELRAESLERRLATLELEVESLKNQITHMRKMSGR